MCNFAEVKGVASALMGDWLGIIRDATGPSGIFRHFCSIA